MNLTTLTENNNLKSWKLYGFSLLGILLLISVSPIFIIDPSEMGNLRRLGSVVYNEPLQSGPHLKFPLIDTVDRLQVSLTTLHIPSFDVNTVDNQKITLDINFNFTIPKNKVNHLLYEVGKTGDFDIETSIVPIVRDRVSRVFNKQNTTNISQNREIIQQEVTDLVFAAMREQFGIEPHSLQFAGIIYSPTFVQSNENAVKAKNDAVAEQNKQVVETAKAQQKVIAAKGEADAAIEAAQGAARSVEIASQAEKTRKTLEGEGQAARLKSEMAMFNNDSKQYIAFMEAQAKLKWNGQLPQIVSGENGGNIMPVISMPSSSNGK